jgi:hypothetical protein
MEYKTINSSRVKIQKSKKENCRTNKKKQPRPPNGPYVVCPHKVGKKKILNAKTIKAYLGRTRRDQTALIARKAPAETTLERKKLNRIVSLTS